MASRAGREEIRRKREQMQLDRDRGELVRIDEWEERITQVIVTSRGKLLSIPSQVKGRLPHLSRQDVLVIDFLVRDALEGLASLTGSAARDSQAGEDQG
jgi:phage terminase Nu1 subunit (DNA packaging protein)